MIVMKQQLDSFLVATRLEKQAALKQWCAPESIFPSNPKLSQVFQFIETNYHQSITLCDVAKSVGYSAAYLTDLVRRQTGKTVNHWIVERRIAEACCLLLETDRTVHEIAEALGYQNVGYFFRQFRQHQGTTPQAWRKSHQKTMNCTRFCNSQATH